MTKMLSDCNYTKVRLLHDMSRLAWFIDKHAKKDAKKAGHKECEKLCMDLEKDLHKHIEKFRKALQNQAKAGKL